MIVWLDGEWLVGFYEDRGEGLTRSIRTEEQWRRGCAGEEMSHITGGETTALQMEE